MKSKDALYEMPSRVREQAQQEFEYYKKMYPHLPDDQLWSMALSSAGAAGRNAQLLYSSWTGLPDPS